MESFHSTVSLYRLFNDSSCVGSSLSSCGGPPASSKTSPYAHRTLTSDHEENLAGNVKQSQADNISFTELNENLRESSEICWLKELFPFCSVCHTFMKMGNQHSGKHTPDCYPKNWDSLLKPQRVQIHFKRRKMEGLEKTEKLHQKIEMITPASTEKQVFGDESDKEQFSNGEGFRETLTMKSPFSSRKTFASKQEPFPHDSDGDLSDYENEISSAFTFYRDEAKSSKTATKNLEKSKNVKSNEKAAAQRVMGKIEEVEAIIRKVSLTSSNWIHNNNKEQDAPQLSSLEHQRTQTWVENQSMDSNEDTRVIVEELRSLDEALSQSLHHALRMEGEGAKGEEQNFLNASISSNQINFFSVERDVYPVTSPTPSARTSSSLGSFSPLLSSPLSSSLTDVTDQHAADGHKVWTNSVEDNLSALGLKGSKSPSCSPGGAETDWHRVQEQFALSTLRLKQDYLLSSGEVPQNEEELWHPEVEESLLFHPSRPKHIDFLRITAPDDDITETPPATPLPNNLWVSSVKEADEKITIGCPDVL